MKLKLDENLGDRGAEMFRAADHEVATVPGQNLTSAPDAGQGGAVVERERKIFYDVEVLWSIRMPLHNFPGSTKRGARRQAVKNR